MELIISICACVVLIPAVAFAAIEWLRVWRTPSEWNAPAITRDDDGSLRVTQHVYCRRDLPSAWRPISSTLWGNAE